LCLVSENGDGALCGNLSFKEMGKCVGILDAVCIDVPFARNVDADVAVVEHSSENALINRNRINAGENASSLLF